VSSAPLALLAATVVAQLPDSPPVAPPGSEQITLVIGYLRWLALAGIVACFISGLIMFTGGRVFDHERFGRAGTYLMMAAVGGAFLYAVFFPLLSNFTGA
jgi:hypothetical protein